MLGALFIVFVAQIAKALVAVKINQNAKYFEGNLILAIIFNLKILINECCQLDRI